MIDFINNNDRKTFIERLHSEGKPNATIKQSRQNVISKGLTTMDTEKTDTPWHQTDPARNAQMHLVRTAIAPVALELVGRLDGNRDEITTLIAELLDSKHSSQAVQKFEERSGSKLDEAQRAIIDTAVKKAQTSVDIVTQMDIAAQKMKAGIDGAEETYQAAKGQLVSLVNQFRTDQIEINLGLRQNLPSRGR